MYSLKEDTEDAGERAHKHQDIQTRRSERLQTCNGRLARNWTGYE